MKKLAIVVFAMLTELNKEGKQWARITFIDPASGKKGTRLFDKMFLAAYKEGDAIEGIEVKTMEVAPYQLGERMLNKRTVVVLKGESDIQALINNHGKESVPGTETIPEVQEAAEAIEGEMQAEEAKLKA